MAPDIPYFIRSTPLEVTAQSWYEPFTNATTSHSSTGLLFVSVPLALVVYLILLASKPPVMWLTQSPLSSEARRYEVATDRTGGVMDHAWVRWPSVPVSVLVGALTHLVWDSLTSGDGYLAERIDVLNRSAVGDLTWVRLLQHASTVVGLAIVAVILWRHRRTLVSADRRRQTVWVLAGLGSIGLLTAIVSVLTTVDRSDSSTTRDWVENILSTASMSGGAAVAISSAVAAAAWWMWFGVAKNRSD